jgi:hypothetical protein
VSSSKVHAELLGEVGRLVRILVDVDRQYGEAGGAVLLVQAREVRHLDAARAAPARPEIDHHDAPALLLQAQVRPVEARQREVGRARLRRQRGSGAAGGEQQHDGRQPANGATKRLKRMGHEVRGQKKKVAPAVSSRLCVLLRSPSRSSE